MIEIEKKPTLVIGYGNSLRSDDGIGQKIAIALSQLNLKNLSTIATHQLTPELVEKIIQFEQVIFIDAQINSEKIQINKIDNINSYPQQNWTHHLNPISLINLTNKLYNKFPQGWLITIPIKNTNFGEQISPEVQIMADNIINNLGKNFLN
ncbi:hydrogenase maturation protease [Cyanobacterium aponinum UTEX 3222]|uniref:hydrogenase maturation protease n=1 Tax=Cyanobacterium aponinum TaxID=379064 RepID=UPI00308AA106|nr:hydrogenase maturation protease [Cyanobacterium aponinum UTEX 3222]